MRPSLVDCPAAVTDFVSAALGTRHWSERKAATGFTDAVASTITANAGHSVFVKAGSIGTGMDEGVTTGAVLAPILPAISPTLLAADILGGWSVAVYEHIPGRDIDTWRNDTVDSMLEVVANIRTRLADPRLPGTVRYVDDFAPLLGTWPALAGRDHPGVVTVEHLRNIDLPVALRVEQLADLEAEWFSALGHGTALQHGDLRRDNIIQRHDGSALSIVDWTHLWSGPGWIDLIRLGPDLALAGYNPEEILRRSCWADADPHAVNVALAGLASRAWRDGHRPEIPSLPGLRKLQRNHGTQALIWLAQRLRGRRGARK